MYKPFPNQNPVTINDTSHGPQKKTAPTHKENTTHSYLY